ncbi:uncharacterized protein LOC121051143 [Rosa chinensis]|uniref:uncharacterized protein LOC121051143 n=1 Tax=Rosa chinensis TaxID=74649 RepID=UPI001AD8B995|nr:uncharacterized protein LOC121051143 [Rosa chinensis]
MNGGGEGLAASATSGAAMAPLDWMFSQVSGEQTADEEVQEGYPIGAMMTRQQGFSYFGWGLWYSDIEAQLSFWLENTCWTNLMMMIDEFFWTNLYDIVLCAICMI